MKTYEEAIMELAGWFNHKDHNPEFWDDYSEERLIGAYRMLTWMSGKTQEEVADDIRAAKLAL